MGLVIIFVNLIADGVHSYNSKPFYNVDEAEEFYNKTIVTENCDDTESIINLDTYLFVCGIWDNNEADKVKHYSPYNNKNVFDEIRNDFIKVGLEKVLK